MSERFFAPDLDPVATHYQLVGDELHHLRAVCRGRVGRQIELFSGAGLRARALVAQISRHEALIQIVEFLPERGSNLNLRIAAAIPKGDRATTLVEKCTELGVGALTPIETERSVTEPGAGKLARWRRTVIEACKQSGRDRLMPIDEPVAWADFAPRAESTRWILDPSGPLATSTAEAPPALVAIGPEGGWTDDELSLADRSGWQRVGLPGHILRVETAALAVAAWLRLHKSARAAQG